MDYRPTFPIIALYLALLLTLISPTIALPTSPTNTQLHRRGLPGAVYICTSPNFRGDCGWVAPSDSCRIPGTGSKAPQSIGPDPGGYCILYEKATCAGKEVQTVRFPGVGASPPTFGGIKCFTGGAQAASANAVVGTAVVAGAAKDGLGDERLAGGVGSAKMEQVKEVVSKMEEEGFPEGLIGLEKRVYY
ncbi:hypothetical protein BDV95DRAFT_138923 [Massariosphaeria phaeospora]|uniref:Uncharacterized protein n=1 Tax=Massariosphaeria phaeospora TaxID=100035 RepID=A0A7C8II25_9PLEO|nr:hypothetical protein BDV95DRAFT_138923 [Massariosphaeria phaeospora]